MSAVVRALRAAEAPDAQVLFCSHCGRRPPADQAEKANARVCTHCGLGLFLVASANIAPQPGDMFVIVDDHMAVCAMSTALEKLVGVSETEAVNRHVGEFFVPADLNVGSGLFAEFVLAARSEGPGDVVELEVQPRQVFGVRITARAGRCGPTPAVVIVFSQ